MPIYKYIIIPLLTIYILINSSDYKGGFFKNYVAITTSPNKLSWLENVFHSLFPSDKEPLKWR